MTSRPLSTPTAYLGGRVLTPAGEVEALLVTDGRIAAVGSSDQVLSGVGEHRTVELDGARVIPSFVDAHVHTIPTGQALTELDLSGARSRSEVLDRLSAHVRTSTASVVVGFNWSESEWTDDQRPPSAEELDRAAGGRPVHLARVDGHSGLVSSAMADVVPGLRGAVGWNDNGWITRTASHLVRDHVDAALDDSARDTYARAALQLAARRGITVVHENGGPNLGPISDLVRVRQAADDLGLTVHAYWGEQADEDVISRARDHGVAGLAGDLCADGALGSRTASLSEPYADDPDGRGFSYLSVEELTNHLAACARAGLQGGFHCIGDQAVSDVITACRQAADRVGVEVFRRSRPRLEHLEMCDPADMATLAELGVTASMQPDFDAQWGGAGRMYEGRLGPTRAAATNLVGSLLRAGVNVALGSDSPVTPLSGWRAVSAAMQHCLPGERLTFSQALTCATVGGRRATGDAGGTISAGEPSDFAVWSAEAIDRIESASAPLPGDAVDVEALLTVARGRHVHDGLS